MIISRSQKSIWVQEGHQKTCIQLFTMKKTDAKRNDLSKTNRSEEAQKPRNLDLFCTSNDGFTGCYRIVARTQLPSTQVSRLTEIFYPTFHHYRLASCPLKH